MFLYFINGWKQKKNKKTQLRSQICACNLYGDNRLFRLRVHWFRSQIKSRIQCAEIPLTFIWLNKCIRIPFVRQQKKITWHVGAKRLGAYKQTIFILSIFICFVASLLLYLFIRSIKSIYSCCVMMRHFLHSTYSKCHLAYIQNVTPLVTDSNLSTSLLRSDYAVPPRAILFYYQQRNNCQCQFALHKMERKYFNNIPL